MDPRNGSQGTDAGPRRPARTASSTSPIDSLLSKLDGAKRTGPGRWVARCPAHEDKRPSLSVRDLDDGRVLLHCFGGCGVDAITAALNVELSDLFPATSGGGRGERMPFYASDALRLIDHEVQAATRLLLVAAKGELAPEQRHRLAQAAGAISNARQACGLAEVRR
jgi:hypothetical protein